MRFAFWIIALMLGFPNLIYGFSQEHYDTRLSDPLFNTGERFAIVVENHAKQNIRLHVDGDPSFFMLSTMGKGIMNVPSLGVAYKIYTRHFMGAPKLALEVSGSVPNERHLQQKRPYFEQMPGAKIDPDIRFSISAPGRRICQNVLPHINLPIETARLPLSYLNIDEDNPTVAVIYITIPPRAETCLAEFRVPGDMSWLDGGHPPAHMISQPAPEPEPVIYALTPMAHFIEALKNRALQFGGVPALVSGSGLVVNFADAASLYVE